MAVVQNKFYNNFENYILALNEVGKTVFRRGIVQRKSFLSSRERLQHQYEDLVLL